MKAKDIPIAENELSLREAVAALAQRALGVVSSQRDDARHSFQAESPCIPIG